MDKFSDHLCEWVPVWVWYLSQDQGTWGQLCNLTINSLHKKTYQKMSSKSGPHFNMNMCMIIDTFTNTSMNLSMKTSRGHNAACRTCICVPCCHALHVLLWLTFSTAPSVWCFSNHSAPLIWTCSRYVCICSSKLARASVSCFCGGESFSHPASSTLHLWSLWSRPRWTICWFILCCFISSRYELVRFHYDL